MEHIHEHMHMRVQPRADAIVERVRLHLAIERPLAVAVSTALAPFDPEVAQRWHAGEPLRPASTPSTVDSRHAAIHVTLRLQSRAADPHELAGWGELECGTGASSSEPADDGEVTLLLAGGGRLLVSRRLLRCHSSMLATLLSSPGWHEAATGEVSLATHDAAVVRGAVAWMAAAGGPPKRQAAAALLTPELVVEAARFCHYAGLQPLLDSAAQLLRSALDAHNAPSVLLLARELELATLEAEATAFILVELDAVEQCDTNFWEDLPPLTCATLRALREATLRNPLLSPSAAPSRLAASCASGDARELLGMVRESLQLQSDRLAEAYARQEAAEAAEAAEAVRELASELARRRRRREQELAARAPGADMRSDACEQTRAKLRQQSRRVGALQTYLRQQEEAFAAILVPPPPRSARAALQVVFVPGYEWRSVPDGAAVPPGLQV